MTYLNRRSSFLLSTAISGFAFSTQANAQNAATGLIAVAELDDVQSWQLNDQGELELTLKNGNIVIVTQDQFELIDGVYYIDPSTADALGVVVEGNNGTLIAGGIGALVGLGGLAFAGDGKDAPPTPTPPPTNDAPIFTSGASASVAENQTGAYDAAASDDDGDALTYSLSGTDAGLGQLG